MNYTAEEVRNAARLLDGLSRRMLTDYAERIEADEGAVPVAWQQKRRPEDYPDEWRECSKETFDFVNQRKESPWIVRELFDNPPAQAAQVGAHLYEYCDAEIQLCIEYSHNYATARPDTPAIVKEHILGLCERLQSVLADRKRATNPHSPDAADSGRVTRDVLAIGVRARNIEITRQQRAGEANNEDHALRIGIAAALATQGQGEAAAGHDEDVVLAALAANPDDAAGQFDEPAPPAGVPDGLVEVSALRNLIRGNGGWASCFNDESFVMWKDIERLIAAPSAHEGDGGGE